MAYIKTRRSKTFTTHINGKLQPGFREAYAFLRKALKIDKNATMESYKISGGKISRAVVYWKVNKRK